MNLDRARAENVSGRRTATGRLKASLAKLGGRHNGGCAIVVVRVRGCEPASDEPIAGEYPRNRIGWTPPSPARSIQSESLNAGAR